MNFDEMVGKFVALRDKIRKLDADHKEQMAPFREALDELNGLMLNHLNEVGADNVKTASGTVYKSSRKTAPIADRSAFWEYVQSNENFDLLDWKANVTAVGDFVEEHNSLPPGVSFNVHQTVGVRRGTKKD